MATTDRDRFTRINLSPRSGKILGSYALFAMHGWFLTKLTLPSADGVAELLVGIAAITGMLHACTPMRTLRNGHPTALGHKVSKMQVTTNPSAPSAAPCWTWSCTIFLREPSKKARQRCGSPSWPPGGMVVAC